MTQQLNTLTRWIQRLRCLLVRCSTKILPVCIIFQFKKFHYRRLLNHFSESLEPDFKMLPYLIRKGDHVVDVGASIGIYTKKLAQLVGHDGCVHSIEPIPEVFKILSANVRALRLENIREYNCCISDSSGIATMEIPIDQRGIENHYLARIITSSSNQGFSKIQVRKNTLDGLFSEARARISFMKIDVEGHELPCIRGAEGIIRRFAPSLLIEVSGKPDEIESGAFRLFAFLNKFGYEPYWFDGINLRRRTTHRDRSTNYFFLGSRHTRILREQGILSS